MPRGLRAALPLCLLVVIPLASVPAGAQDDLVSQARRLDLAGKQDDAIALYAQALQRTPNSFDAQYGIARALDLAGRYAEARDHFTRAIALASEGEKDQALRMMGVSYAFVGDSRAAAPYFQQVFDRRVKAGNFAGAAEVANELARVYLELGDLDAARREYRTAFDTAARQPARSAADVDLAALRWAHAQARIAARQGNVAEARRQEAAVKALVDKGTNADQQVQYAYLVGYDAFYLKDYSKAIAALRMADETDPFILLLLARAYEESGQPALAREYYQKTFASTSHAVNNAFARPVARQKLGAAQR
jgi:tetratricopeptide (TPR) repeat protein